MWWLCVEPLEVVAVLSPRLWWLCVEPPDVVAVWCNEALLSYVLLQIVIVGNGAVGKSSMIQKYCRGIFTNEYKKTIGVDFLEKRLQ